MVISQPSVVWWRMTSHQIILLRKGAGIQSLGGISCPGKLFLGGIGFYPSSSSSFCLFTFNRYMDKSLRDGSSLSDEAPEMKNEDLNIMCNLLFQKGREEDIRNRCLLILQWQLFGRIAEVSSLRVIDFSIFEGDLNRHRCLKVWWRSFSIHLI